MFEKSFIPHYICIIKQEYTMYVVLFSSKLINSVTMVKYLKGVRVTIKKLVHLIIFEKVHVCKQAVSKKMGYKAHIS